MTTTEKIKAMRKHVELRADVTIAAEAMETHMNDLLDAIVERDNEIEGLKERIEELEEEIAAKDVTP